MSGTTYKCEFQFKFFGSFRWAGAFVILGPD